MVVFLSILLELLRLPFRAVGWLLLLLAGESRNDLHKLNAAVASLNNDRTVTKGRFKRKYRYD